MTPGGGAPATQCLRRAGGGAAGGAGERARGARPSALGRRPSALGGPQKGPKSAPPGRIGGARARGPAGRLPEAPGARGRARRLDVPARSARAGPRVDCAAGGLPGTCGWSGARPRRLSHPHLQGRLHDISFRVQVRVECVECVGGPARAPRRFGGAFGGGFKTTLERLPDPVKGPPAPLKAHPAPLKPHPPGRPPPAGAAQALASAGPPAPPAASPGKIVPPG